MWEKINAPSQQVQWGHTDVAREAPMRVTQLSLGAEGVQVGQPSKRGQAGKMSLEREEAISQEKVGGG